MSEYEVCGYGVELTGAIIDIDKSLGTAEYLAEIIDGAEVVPVYREIKQEEKSHETAE